MAQKVTIGGDRVGSGKKMQAELHDYYRSTHNLSEDWASSMASGVLYPAMCKLAMRGDSFDINIAADARTIPTVGPLFGSFKMQIDVYQCPVRLYQAILHNNPYAIGLNMSQVKFPILQVETTNKAGDGHESGKFSDSCLLKYLGMSGLGHSANLQVDTKIGRKINALPALSYYDIFKTYYANKQEENAYVITPENIQTENAKVGYINMQYWDANNKASYEHNSWTPYWNSDDVSDEYELYKGTNRRYFAYLTVYMATERLDLIEIKDKNDNEKSIGTIQSLIGEGHLTIEYKGKVNLMPSNPLSRYNGFYYYHIKIDETITNLIKSEDDDDGNEYYSLKLGNLVTNIYESDIKLQPFKLSNIDDMRYDLLGHHQLGTAFVIKEDKDNPPYEPYSVLVNGDLESGKSWNKFAMNGLVLKTYQNDIFNNWLNTEWIEGENGINELTKVAVVDGAFSMDALNMSMKLYNMLNRIALAGGTYEEWQDVVYEEVRRKQIESPIFIGGMSQEIMFDEIVQSAPTDGNPLGTLGGRGKLVGNKKGGRIHVKCDEACFIIAIVSLTPRLYYTQGNEFYMTDIFSMDDLHKPAMDGIGFQDLIGERMAYFDTVIAPDTTHILHRSKIGKLPAWIEYMTSVNKAYGDFAGEYGKGFMILNRNYEQSESGGIKDATTYIDPSKYNYAFAVQELAAQNFWVQIHFDIKARRLMSARLIPNV